MQRLHLDTNRITDWPSFHAAFDDLFDFPDYYGHNMDAWIDCMSDVIAGHTVLLDLTHAEEFRMRLPEVFEALVDCTAFVNQRYPSVGSGSRLYLGFL